jgi:hypothetical protein
MIKLNTPNFLDRYYHAIFFFLVEFEYGNDFSSKAAMEKEGWIFSHNDKNVFIQGGKFCKDLPVTSYCGFMHPGDLMVSYKFSYSGSATLKYGRSFAFGCVQVKKNNVKIASRCSPGSSITTFAFISGDVIQLVEVDRSVINIHFLTLTRGSKWNLQYF